MIGGYHSGKQRIRRQGQVAAHPPGQSLRARGTGHRGDVDLAHPKYPPGRQISPDRSPPRPLRAHVAVQRALLVAIWNITTTATGYRDAGGDHFTRLNPQKARSAAVRQLEAMGYHVTLDKAS